MIDAVTKIIPVLFLFISLKSTSQNPTVTFSGTLTNILVSPVEAAPADPVAIQIWTNDALVSTQFADESGQYKLDLQAGKNHRIRFEASSFLGKMIDVNLSNMKMVPDPVELHAEMDISLFENKNFNEFGFLSEIPVAVLEYDSAKNELTWNKNHSERVNDCVRKAMMQGEFKNYVP